MGRKPQPEAMEGIMHKSSLEHEFNFPTLRSSVGFNPFICSRVFLKTSKFSMQQSHLHPKPQASSNLRVGRGKTTCGHKSVSCARRRRAWSSECLAVAFGKDASKLSRRASRR